MGNSIFVRDTSFASYTIVGSSSEAVGFPSSNIAVPERRDSTWRTTGTGDSWVTMDFGSATSIAAVALINCNFGTYKIQGNSSDSWSLPPFDSGNLASMSEGFTGLRRSFKILTGFNYRYMRLFIPTQTPADGLGFFFVGGFIALKQAPELSINPSYGMSLNTIKPTSDIEFTNGRVDKLYWRGNSKILSLRMGFDLDRSQQDIDSIFSLFAHSGLILFYPNGALREYPDDTPLTFLMEPISQVDYSISGWGTAAMEVALLEKV